MLAEGDAASPSHPALVVVSKYSDPLVSVVAVQVLIAVEVLDLRLLEAAQKLGLLAEDLDRAESKDVVALGEGARDEDLDGLDGIVEELLVDLTDTATVFPHHDDVPSSTQALRCAYPSCSS